MDRGRQRDVYGTNMIGKDTLYMHSQYDVL